jgi:hypothetical protein
MSIKLHLYLSSLKYISLDVTANARYFLIKTRSSHLFTDGYHVFCTIYSVHTFFSHFILYDNGFNFFQLMVISYYVMFKEKNEIRNTGF